MVTLEIVAGARAIREFIDLPPRIYRQFKSFEPPLRVDRILLFDPKKNPFWEHARGHYWLARIDGRAVGRISAQIPETAPYGIAATTGMFGCLDAIDDRQVVEALLGCARNWLIEQGCSEMIGPFTLDMNDEPGLLVAGADEPAMTLYPWHPPYLGQLVEQAGLSKLRDLHGWKLDLAQSPPAATEALQLGGRIPNLLIRHPTRKSYTRDIRTLCEVFNDGWRDKWGFVPLTPEDLAGLDLLMKWFVPGDAFKIIELRGKPVAVMLLIPNLVELTRGLGVAPGPFGWMRLIWRAFTHRFSSGRIIVTGIAKHLQGTVTGAAIAALLVDELVAGHAIFGGEWVEAGWVLEDNRPLVQILERFNFRRNRTFRIYCQAFTADAGQPSQGLD